MKAMIALVALAFVTSSAFAADDQAKKTPSPAQQAQQEKMKACNADAKTKALKGAERKKFMSECLGSKPAPAATQQDKMKICNADAKTKALKGDERKQFMSQCLKADKP
ncbi:PsiF family protein [Propionivibrio sp.]|uniref:PsiF family protein n=1 Tax=Propionivibrio sp. TaxID=2212460 RepID=UPI0025EFF2B5|nr:PsiF family protein [Propionivibrio sp.]MBK8400710.1 phosphate-starvation-inducible protein PsiF [Propionivibrio sp.]MBK8744742.1 phosphate-starvation-inducible protein PsiF [Propionivibrio sp.]MBK8893609.1 phosphate-starvation-inducible protein PsiF [Propionivibrio sp.]MBL0207744.1 phosphate-starvation-inducible protein PsiF [Propionivibrio sp.]